MYLGPNLISSWSKKQTLVAQSSSEVEYRSLANKAAEMSWIQTLHQELKNSVTIPTVECDDLCTVSLSHNIREKILDQSNRL